MRQLSIILAILATLLTFSLASCTGTAKTEEKKEAARQAETKLIESFEILVDKSLELESRVLSGDEEEVVTTEYDETKKEIQKFLVDNKKAIDKLSPQAKADFQALTDKTTLGAQ